jgi:hypothetical protein
VIEGESSFYEYVLDSCVFLDLFLFEWPTRHVCAFYSPPCLFFHSFEASSGDCSGAHLRRNQKANFFM